MVRGVFWSVFLSSSRNKHTVYDCSRLEATSEGFSMAGLKPARRQPKLYNIKNVYKQACVLSFIKFQCSDGYFTLILLLLLLLNCN
jgi:hypothetical protein